MCKYFPTFKFKTRSMSFYVRNGCLIDLENTNEFILTGGGNPPRTDAIQYSSQVAKTKYDFNTKKKYDSPFSGYDQKASTFEYWAKAPWLRHLF